MATEKNSDGRTSCWNLEETSEEKDSRNMDVINIESLNIAHAVTTDHQSVA